MKTKSQREREPLRGVQSLKDPLRGKFCSLRLSVLSPLIGAKSGNPGPTRNSSRAGVSIAARGAERKQGSRCFGADVLGPLRGLGIRPLVSAIRSLVGSPLPGAPFSEKKVGHSEAPKRSRFPGCPLRGFQRLGSYMSSAMPLQQLEKSAGRRRVPKSQGYVNQSFVGVKKGGMKGGEVKRGKGAREGTVLEKRKEGEEGGQKGGRKGARKHTRKNSDFGIPMIQVLFSGV